MSDEGDPLTVAVYVPSFGMSGDTHRMAVGDRADWRLSVSADPWLVPDALLATLNATAEAAAPPIAQTRSYPMLLRQDGLTAWWDPGRPVSGKVELRAWFQMDDTRVDPEDSPHTAGTIRRLYYALDLLRQAGERRDGGWVPAPVLGLAEVESTEVDPPSRFTAHLAEPGIDVNDGRWRHLGWMAMLEVANLPDR